MNPSIKNFRIKSVPIDENTEKYAMEIAVLDGVEDIVLLPDSYTKIKYIDLDYKITIPSSSAIATHSDILYPQFRSRGLNCGMMLVALPIKCSDLPDNFFSELAEVFTVNSSYFLAHRLRLPILKKDTDFTLSEFYRAIGGDIKFLEEKYQLDIPKDILRDFGDSARKQEVCEIEGLLNSQWLSKRTVRMRHKVGRYFSGNHYFELQKVTEDIPELGLSSGQVVAMFHGGCQGIESVVRQDLAQKYFYSKDFVSTKKGEDMYEAYFAAQSLLIHYGLSYRIATASLLNKYLNKESLGDIRIVLDKGHNFVRTEDFNGSKKLVYRHNAERLVAGDYSILSGTSNHSSYILKGEKHTDKFLHSIDHGLGSLIGEGKETESKVQLKKFKRGLKGSVIEDIKKAIIETDVADEYIKFIEANEVASKVGSLKPIFNIKHKT